MTDTNVLIIMDDEHNKQMLGCHGHPLVRTPNIDRLARQGTRFASAYTNSPICVPARACLATGRHLHEIGYWDNAIAYDGRVPSWHHRLQQHGRHVVSIGKLHFVDEKAPTGFDEQLIPMHIECGVGDLYGLLREPLPVRHQSRDLARRIGPGSTTYIEYDRQITELTVDWLANKARQRRDKPWVLFCSYISPHSPLVAPPEYYAMYPPERVPLPKKRPAGFSHPWWDAFNRCYIFDESFADDAQRRIAIASYFGLCSFVDHNVGRVLHALESAGLAGETRVLFMSDHGGNMGARGLWGKSNMYEESAGVPMMMRGPGIEADRVVHTPVSHVDVFPTVLRWAGVPADAADADLPGAALDEIARAPCDDERIVFSEYHAAGAASGVFMLRQGRYKYIHYLGFASELYDLQSDPDELVDLAPSPAYAGTLRRFESLLRSRCDPHAIDRAAKADQAALIQRHGGAQAILARGGGSYTPVPGEQPVFIKQ